ncbi:hypothetical protein cand_009360 [Cryptosporidium andersoni]|uniref:Beta-catenin-like protein 1 N-terminal domain-containing protein n=1 Tax=Cryptosporidium andersoni TaxID=117008 RepID=A0A1J4MWZ9_9CRYT|nr:hypothetical protein cand_009360 [Cryptosporidium andersoni]
MECEHNKKIRLEEKKSIRKKEDTIEDINNTKVNSLTIENLNSFLDILKSKLSRLYKDSNNVVDIYSLISSEITELWMIGVSRKMTLKFIELGGMNIFRQLLYIKEEHNFINNTSKNEIYGVVLGILCDITDPDINEGDDDISIENYTDKTYWSNILESIEHSIGFSLIGEVLMNLENSISTDIDNNKENIDTAISKGLQLIENLLDIDPIQVSNKIFAAKELYNILLSCLKSEKLEINSNFAHKAEILCILVQNSLECCRNTFEKYNNSILDLILVTLAKFGLRKEEPKFIEEKEFLFNLSDILSVILLENEARVVFNKLEGIDLMIRLMREAIFLRPLATKIISFSLINSSENCNLFIEMYGLKPLFALLAYSIEILDKKKKVRNVEQRDLDEHICSIIQSLIQYSNDKNLKRVINKFVEHDFIKTDAILKLRKFYANNVEEALDFLDDNNLEDIQNSKLVDAGLFTIQLIDLILLHLIVYLAQNSRHFSALLPINNIEQLFLKYNLKGSDILNNIEDYCENLGSNGKEATKLDSIIKYFKSIQFKP